MKIIKMNNQVINLIRSIFLIASTAILLVSCEKTEVMEDFVPSRNFTPASIKVTAGETQALLEWSASLYSAGKGVKYTVEVSKDPAFAAIDYTVVADTNFLTITDDKLTIKQKYYARVKANATATSAASNFIASPEFTITGEQIFSAIVASELKDKSVILRWRTSPGLTKITLKPATGASIDVTLTPADVAANFKSITGLTPSTNYTAEIFAGTKTKGLITFLTKDLNIFTVEITPADDLQVVINNAANNDVIGLAPGTYTFALPLVITGKHITIQSTSGNPLNTRINFKEITLKGTGAGVKVSGIEFDGTAGNADYFINLVGLTSDAEAATFTSVFIDNCIVRKTNNCLMRANRGGNNAHKIDFIRVNNSITSGNGTGAYHYFMLDKLEFKTLEVKNSTMYDIARAFISWATVLTVPTRPVILIDQSTINSFGFADRNFIALDANTNNVDFTMQNTIMANTPKPGQTILGVALRSGTGGTVKVTNNDFFNFNGGTPAAPLTWPAHVTLTANKAIDLGWTATTTSFTLPAVSDLRTAGTTGQAIGDPRWR